MVCCLTWVLLQIIYNQCQNCIKVFKIHHVTSLEDPESCDKPKSERCKHKSHSSYQKDSFVLEIEIDENIHQPCRRDSKEIFICDSPETKEIPDVEEIPKNLTTFILTKTQVWITSIYPNCWGLFGRERFFKAVALQI